LRVEIVGTVAEGLNKGRRQKVEGGKEKDEDGGGKPSASLNYSRASVVKNISLT
jgi:hypothetical protein